MLKKFLMITIGVLPILGFAQCKKFTTYQITTGSKTGTYYQIGLNLAKYVAPDACIKLDVINSNGSLDNAYKLRSAKYPKLKFAIVQNDVLGELRNLAATGDKQAKDLVKNLRVIKALYNEEIHIISKKGAAINTFGDLKGKVISVGPQKSGTAMTSLLLYKDLFGENLERFKFQKFNDALKSLETGDVDAVVKVAGQPVGGLSKFGADASNFIQLLSYDERNSAHKPITTYYDAEIMNSSYAWTDSDVQTLSTKSYLITFDYKNEPTKGNIKKFVEGINHHIVSLQNKATKDTDTPHLKWKEVSKECNTPLPGSWEYYSAAKEACSNTNSSSSGVDSNCTPYRKSLGLCQ